MYSFRFDANARILHIRTEGMWTVATLAAYAAESLMRGAALKLRYRRFSVIADVRDFPVQTAEVAKAFELLMAKSADLITAPSAIVVSSMLSKLQAERVGKHPLMRVFLDHDQAVAWVKREWSVQQTA